MTPSSSKTRAGPRRVHGEALGHGLRQQPATIMTIIIHDDTSTNTNNIMIILYGNTSIDYYILL